MEDKDRTISNPYRNRYCDSCENGKIRSEDDLLCAYKGCWCYVVEECNEYRPKRMTLDEAIAHLKEMLGSHDFGCAECKAEHKQLLTWLEELRERRHR